MIRALCCLFSLLATTVLMGSKLTMDKECYPYIDKVSGETSAELRDRYQLSYAGGGLLDMAFEVPRSLTKEESRHLLVKAIDLYVDRLNADPYLKANCSDYPFSVKSVDIALFNRGQHNWVCLYPRPELIMNIQDTLIYDYYKPDHRYQRFAEVRESYEDAKAILATSGFTDSDLEANKPFNQAAQQTIDRFAKQMKREHTLEYWGAGYSPDHFAIQFSLFRPMKVKEARRIILETTASFIRAVNSSPELAPYLSDRPITRDDVEVGIYSHMKKTPGLRRERPTAPFVEVVAQEGDTVIYRLTDSELEHHRTTETIDIAHQRILGGNDEVAQFAEKVGKMNLENSLENRLKRS